MYSQLLNMLEQMVDHDFNETPNLKAMVAIRDYLIEEEYDEKFANDFVASMKIEVSGASCEQATELGRKYAEVLVKFIEVMYNNGFDDKHIISMASTQMSLKYE